MFCRAQPSGKVSWYPRYELHGVSVCDVPAGPQPAELHRTTLNWYVTGFLAKFVTPITVEPEVATLPYVVQSQPPAPFRLAYVTYALVIASPPSPFEFHPK